MDVKASFCGLRIKQRSSVSTKDIVIFVYVNVGIDYLPVLKIYGKSWFARGIVFHAGEVQFKRRILINFYPAANIFCSET